MMAYFRAVCLSYQTNFFLTGCIDKLQTVLNFFTASESRVRQIPYEVLPPATPASIFKIVIQYWNKMKMVWDPKFGLISQFGLLYEVTLMKNYASNSVC
jgi:hypothetical protein